MANTIKIKRSAVQGKVPTTGDLQLGELALNTYDGKLYTLKDSGTPSVVEIGASGVTSFSAGTTGLTPSTATSGAVTLAGTLAVANGGTGVTTSTGSGSNVLSTSPTLVTPVLGTPTSGTLTNCTGYTFANLASKPTTLSGYGITDAATSTHTHGNITNAGAIGSTANLPIITTTSGVLTTGSFGTTANTFCQGNDARLSNTRNTTNNVTFNNAGSGGASGSTFNGSSALTVSYNTLGALPSVIAQQGGKTYVAHDFNTYPSLYDVTFVNPTGSTNLPTGMSSVMSYRFIMGAGDTTARGFDLVGAAEGSANLYMRERSIGTWSRILHSNNYNSYAPTLTGTGASGSWGISVTGSAGSVAWSGITSKPTTLSGYGITDAASSTHTHGNITNAGAIGSTANLPIITTTSGVLTTGSFGTTANTFCQGNDSRLSDTRNTTNSITLSASGDGVAAGSTFNGSVARIFSYNSVGAPSTSGANATGTWSINITGNSASVTNGVYLNTNQTLTAAKRGAITAQGAVSGTVTLDFNTTNHFSMTLPAGGSITLATPSNITAGQSGAIVITQNATTAATVAYSTAWKFSGGTPVMSTGLGTVSTLVYFVESATRITAQLLTNVA